MQPGTCSWCFALVHKLYCRMVFEARTLQHLSGMSRMYLLPVTFGAAQIGINVAASILVQGVVLLPASGEGCSCRAAGNSSRGGGHSSSIGVCTKQQVRWTPVCRVAHLCRACSTLAHMPLARGGGLRTCRVLSPARQGARTGDVLPTRTHAHHCDSHLLDDM
jgi:hypothetical protein